jgi:hypothetical protein
MSDAMDWNKILDKQAAEGAANIPVEGKYPIIVIESEAIVAGSGNNMIKLRCRVTEGPYKDKDAWTNIVFALDSEVAMKFTLRKLRALGVTREYLRTHNPTTKQIAALLKGAEAEAEIGISEFEGEAQNEIKSFKSLHTTGLGGVSAPVPPVPSPPVPDPAAPPRPPMTAEDVPPPPVPATPPVPQPTPSDQSYVPSDEPF